MSERSDAQRLDDAIAALLTGAPVELVLSRADRDLAPYLRAFSQLQALQPAIPPPSEEFRLRLRSRFVQGANREARVARGRGGRFQRAAVAGAASLILGSAINPALAHELVNHVRQTMGRAAADVLNAALFVERQMNPESQVPQQAAAESNPGTPRGAEFADSEDEHGRASVPSEDGKDLDTSQPPAPDGPANVGEAQAQPGGPVTNIPEQAPEHVPGPPDEVPPPRDEESGEPSEPASAAPPVAADPPKPRADESPRPSTSELPKAPEKPEQPSVPERDKEASSPLAPPPVAGNPGPPPADEAPVVEEPAEPVEEPGEPGDDEGGFDPADNSAAGDGPPGLDGDLPPGHDGEVPANSGSNGNGNGNSNSNSNKNGPPEHAAGNAPPEHVVAKGGLPASVRAASNGNSAGASSPGTSQGKGSTQHGPESAAANGNAQGTPAESPKSAGNPKSAGAETRGQSPASTPSSGNSQQPKSSGANEPGAGGSGKSPEPGVDKQTATEPDRDLSQVRGTNRGPESDGDSKSTPGTNPGNR